MTTPNERIEALNNINQFLMDMAYIRKREDRIKFAQKLLRHYPTNSELRILWGIVDESTSSLRSLFFYPRRNHPQGESLMCKPSGAKLF
jgi:hypothetical protein